MMAGMASRVHTITFDCAEWQPLLAFWAEVLDFVEDPNDPNSPDDPQGLIQASDGSLRMLFIPVPEGKQAKNRVHLDLTPTDRTRDEEVERVLRLGASLHSDFRRPDGSGFVVLQDLEGNELCIERSEAERRG